MPNIFYIKNGDTLRRKPFGQGNVTIVIVIAPKTIVRSFASIDVASYLPRQNSLKSERYVLGIGPKPEPK